MNMLLKSLYILWSLNSCNNIWHFNISGNDVTDNSMFIELCFLKSYLNF